MPGHVKAGKPGEADPDPLPYLVLTMDMKRADMLLPYDPKKSYYCPDGKHGFMECMLEKIEGGKATVMCGHEVIHNLLIDIYHGKEVLNLVGMRNFSLLYICCCRH